jgi:hypothetical protein
MKSASVFGGVLLLASLAVLAAPNSPGRVQAFARLPNWTGLWETFSSKAITNPAGRSARFVGASSPLAGHPPYNPDWERKYQAALSDRAAAAREALTTKSCGAGTPAFASNFPLILERPLVLEIAVTPEVTLFVMDRGGVRHIYTDGRSHPGKDDLWPTPLGDSVGHWEGQTLVIDTVATPPGRISLFTPAELSEQAHFIERLRLLDKNTLEDELTIEDSVSLARPWTMRLQFTRVQDLTRFIPYDCEADRNPVENGKVGIAPIQ